MTAATTTTATHSNHDERDSAAAGRSLLCIMASSEGGGGSMRGTSTESGASHGDELGGGRTAPRPRAGTSSLEPDTMERSQRGLGGSSAPGRPAHGRGA